MNASHCFKRAVKTMVMTEKEQLEFSIDLCLSRHWSCQPGIGLPSGPGPPCRGNPRQKKSKKKLVRVCRALVVNTTCSNCNGPWFDSCRRCFFNNDCITFSFGQLHRAKLSGYLAKTLQLLFQAVDLIPASFNRIFVSISSRA